MLFKVLSMKIDEIYVQKLCFLVAMVSFVQGFQFGFGRFLFGEQVLDDEPEFNPVLVTLGALLVGNGVRWAGGCTSGHGVCGIPRLSKRSFIAVPVFMVTGILTATGLSYFPVLPPTIQISESFKSNFYNYFTFSLLALAQLAAVFGMAYTMLKSEGILQKTLPVFYSCTGALFGAGLLISGMCSRLKILSFLTVNGNWDPSLAFVMAAAVGINFVTFQLVIRRGSAVFSEEVDLPDTFIDKGVFLGSGLFGIGWGITGFCPGPALTNIAALTFAFPIVLIIFAGQGLHDFIDEKMSNYESVDQKVPLIVRN
jgi:uncharacterized membrane protein YedE/YeeE